MKKATCVLRDRLGNARAPSAVRSNDEQTQRVVSVDLHVDRQALRVWACRPGAAHLCVPFWAAVTASYNHRPSIFDTK